MLAPQGDKPMTLVTTTVFSDYELSLEYRAKKSDSMSVLTTADAQGQGAVRPGSDLFSKDPARGILVGFRILRARGATPEQAAQIVHGKVGDEPWRKFLANKRWSSQLK